MLFEGLIHLLVEQGTVGKEEVVSTIEGIIEVEQEAAVASPAIVVDIASILVLQTLMRSVSTASPSENPAVARPAREG